MYNNAYSPLRFRQTIYMADLVIRPSIKGIILWYVLSVFLLIGVVVFMQTRGFQPVELWALLAIPFTIDLWASM